MNKINLLLTSCLFFGVGSAHAEETVIAPEMVPNTEPIPHASSGLPQFDLTTWPSQIFWLTIFFVISYVAYAKFILPAISGTIQNRDEYIEKNLTIAEELSKESAKLMAEVNAGLRSANHTANDIVRAAETTTKTNLNNFLHQFHDRFKNEIAKTEQNIETAKENAKDDINNIISELAAHSAEKIAGVKITTNDAKVIISQITEKTRKVA